MNYLDYIIIVVYLVGFLGLGFLFKENSSGGDYFLGGRKTSWLPLSLSAMATQLSAISFISAPAFVGLKDGGGMQWLTYELGVPLAMAFLLVAVLPTLYKSGIVSVYEYLEKRFDASSRLLISFVFQISRSVATGVMVYTMALILQATIQLDFWISVLIIGVITMVYSFQGGMKAVIWGDVIQMSILFLGIIICLFYGFSELGGIDSFLANVDQDRITAIDFDKWGFSNADGNDEFGFWPMVIGGFFLYASYYGTDQTQSQRLLSSSSMSNLKKLMMANGLLRFPFTLTYCIMGLVLGTLLMQDLGFQDQMESVYQANISSLEGKKADLLVPVFIIKYLPNGVIGILIVAIMSAAMSTLSSTVNSLSAVTMEDFVKRFKPNMGDKQYMSYSRLLSIFWGLVCLFFAFFAGNIEGTVIEVINKISSVFYGPILAAFILAILTKRTHALGANIGIVAGVLFNIYLWLYVPQIFWFWWNALGCLVTILIALAVSYTVKRTVNEGLEVVYYSGKKEVAILVGYFVIILCACLLLPSVFN
ncbi:sodium:solute symporter [Zobellia galactanivorans]|uniref:Sodium/iodide symporter n=1 Tax=Zobellia galactanivorans (strain DSM 12802 / CCUG 47099 / CIP 106680 / NCIMB 13871 / Dsij) TaxID=63186 RepID=G0L5N4_ZOBGA|nr:MULTISPECIES: sodium:solute symporter [Zobellia]MBU3026168.1 sodium:solute symporter [Zobellia galactanivorans]MDO6807355.1 sodium:solute symporter [Zobellia galactanivorans]OWW27248.1 sodium transporter [Zobellia sp. OII3]CAZ96384.1 Sodium/iodide symporter [Zobellia galactanivorans]